MDNDTDEDLLVAKLAAQAYPSNITPLPQAERVLITVHSGEIDIFCHVMRTIRDYCRENGYDKAMVRHSPEGHQVFLPSTEKHEHDKDRHRESASDPGSPSPGNDQGGA